MTLELNVEYTLEPRVHFLRESVGIGQDSIAKVRHSAACSQTVCTVPAWETCSAALSCHRVRITFLRNVCQARGPQEDLTLALELRAII